MSSSTGRNVSISGGTLIWAIAAMFIATVAGVVILAVALPESQNPAALVGQLLGSFAVLTASIGAIFTVQRASQKIDQVEEVVNATAQGTAQIVEQTNGALDARVRALSYESTIRALEDHLGDKKEGGR